MATTNRPVAFALAVTLVLVGVGLYRAVSTAGRPTDAELASARVPGLPSLLELGSDSCASCIAMKKVLAELARRHSGRLNVESIDVVRRPDLAGQWRIKVIPTQIFLDTEGQELGRHVGYLSAQGVEARFHAAGVPLAAPQPGTR